MRCTRDRRFNGDIHVRHSRLCSTTLGVLSAIALSGHARIAASQPSNPGFVIAHVRVFDGRQSHTDRNVVIVGGRIQAVVESLDAWRHLPVVDGTGATLIPGLIDAHSHTQNVTDLQQALRFGVTTVLDMFTDPAVEQGLRDAAKRRVDVADFRSAGVLATAPGGHGTEYGIAIPTVARASDAEAFVAARKAGGSDYLKIVLNGVRAARGTPTLDAATATALVRAAHSRGMVAVAHVESTEDVRIAVSSGVDGLAHIWREGGAAPDIAELVARKNVFVIPTLATPEGFVKNSGVSLANDSRLRPFLSDTIIALLSGSAKGPVIEDFKPFLDAVGSLRAADALVLAGSDVPNAITAHGVSLHRELELLVRAGLTPTEALAAATANVAVAFKIPDRGMIAPGCRADLVLVRGDPTSDIMATRDILRVWRSGVEFDRRATPAEAKSREPSIPAAKASSDLPAESTLTVCR
ncbi:MAG: amidohydrolase family protein [Anaerolineae bacterium]|nr:amidohydrolase family protein [Gemmatimonadaceae bacterium]